MFFKEGFFLNCTIFTKNTFFYRIPLVAATVSIILVLLLLNLNSISRFISGVVFQYPLKTENLMV